MKIVGGFFERVSVVAACLAGLVFACEAAGEPAFRWSCSPHAAITGDSLVVDVPKGVTNAQACARAPIDLEPYEFHGFEVSVRARGWDVSEPPNSWNGIKVMVGYDEIVFEETFYPQAKAFTGTCGWTNLTFRSMLPGKRARNGFLLLGLENSSGRVEFDLASLKVRKVPAGKTFDLCNRDYRIGYPQFVLERPQQAGVMLGLSDEREFRDLKAMGATLVRYQMTCDWKKQFPEGDGIAQFRPWMKARLDHLEEMLPWARKYGIRICVDWHWPAGGNTAKDSNKIFDEEVYRDLFISQWQEIARRFKGNHDVIYGYDLVNEPIDRGGNRYDFPTVMEACARAVRAIDPDTPIVYEANYNATPNGFGFLSPMRMDNVIYSVHMYMPMDFTHQGIGKTRETWTPVAYPNPEKGWDKEYLRKKLQTVRDFQLQTGARIFVGEFSAAAYAPGAENYIRDCCELFREYGWDWTFHAFREAYCWSIEHEGDAYDTLKWAKGKTPRAVVLERFFREARPAAK